MRRSRRGRAACSVGDRTSPSAREPARPTDRLQDTGERSAALFAMSRRRVAQCDGMQYKRPHRAPDELLRPARPALNSHRSPLGRVHDGGGGGMPTCRSLRYRAPNPGPLSAPVSNLRRPSVKMSRPPARAPSTHRNHRPISATNYRLESSLLSHFGTTRPEPPTIRRRNVLAGNRRMLPIRVCCMR